MRTSPRTHRPAVPTPVRRAAFALLLLVAACSRGEVGEAASTAIPLAASASAGGQVQEETRPRATLDLLQDVDACTFGHRGILLDLGDGMTSARAAGMKVRGPELPVREREGASWVAVRERQLELSFVVPSEIRGDAGILVEARVRGGSAKSASVYLGSRPVGALPLVRGETKIVGLRAPNMSVLRGENTLLLRFGAPAKGAHDELAEIDWIRVGAYDGEAPYAAPTRSDVVTTATVGGVARRGFSLRAPGFARCSGFLPRGATLEGFVSVSGGEADAEVRLLVDRAEPRVLGAYHLGGEGAPAWVPVSLPIGDARTLGAIELVATRSSRGARVLFAEPRVVADEVAVAPSTAKGPRGVALVVLGSTSPRMLAPWGGTLETPELLALVRGGTSFEAHRATTSFANGTLASMLTGLSPRDHGIANVDAALAPQVTTLAEAVRRAGVTSAMFTANPTTSAAFGFSRGWETFTARTPEDAAGGLAVFQDAARWLDGHPKERFFLVVHARGGHPPWDAPPEVQKTLPPRGYLGSLDAKHAGEMLAKARRERSRSSFTDSDRERGYALYRDAVVAHDAALGRLVGHVRATGADDVLWIVTGDVGLDRAAPVPFLEDESLDEGALSVPLVLHGPRVPSGRRVTTTTTALDVARTVYDALGLTPPAELGGESLTRLPLTRDAAERPALAITRARFAARWGPFVLSGVRERETKLCNLALESECVSDVRATHPIATELLHRLIVRDFASAPGPRPAYRTTGDATVEAALRAWGR